VQIVIINSSIHKIINVRTEAKIITWDS